MAVLNDQGTSVAGPGLEDPVHIEQVEIQVKYAGYVARQQDEVTRQAALEEQAIPEDLDYDDIKGLSIEVRQRLKAAKPLTIGQAGRVQGVTPAAVSLLLVHLKRKQKNKQTA